MTLLPLQLVDIIQKETLALHLHKMARREIKSRNKVGHQCVIEPARQKLVPDQLVGLVQEQEDQFD